MSALSIVFLAKLLGSLIAGPIVLSRSDINEDYYDEAPAELEGRSDWLGLFVTDGGSRLDPVRVDFVPRQDGAVTVFRLVTDPPDAELLFSDVRPLSAGPVTTVVRWPVGLRPQQPHTELRIGTRSYEIQLQASDPHLCDALITLSHRNTRQKLYEPGQSGFACDEPHFDILWAGDLDRDGKLDLLVTFSSKYSYYPRQLFLSSSSRPEDLVSEVARYERFAQ